MPKNRKPEPPPPPGEDISHQLGRMLISPDFNATPQQKAFINFIVYRTLAGKSRELKDDALATEVFGRGPDYDPNIDPVVSIQACILRRRLNRYYETAGKNDPIRIHLPTGTLVPVFERRQNA